MFVCLMITLLFIISVQIVENRSSKLIPLSVLFGNPDLEFVRLSPDGKCIAYLAPYKEVMNIWVQSIDELLGGNSTANVVTFESARGIRGFRWTYLSGILVYMNDKDGDENWRLWKLNTLEKPFESKIIFKQNDVRARVLALNYKRKNLMVIGVNDRDKRYYDLYEINLITGDKKLYLKNDKFSSFIFDNNMRLRLASKRISNGNKVYYKAIWSENGPKIVNWTVHRTVKFEDSRLTSLHGFSEDNSHAYWVVSVGNDLGMLVLEKFENSRKKVGIFVPRKAEISAILSHPIEKNIMVVWVNYKKPEFFVIDESIKDDLDLLKDLEPDGILKQLKTSLDLKRWMVTYQFDNQSSKYYFYDREQKKAQFLFTTRKNLLAFQLSKMNSVEIKSRDGLVQLCYLSLPIESDPKESGFPLKPVPLVIKVHGGPWTRNSWGMFPGVQHLTNRGYGALQCNYRSSTGLGKKLINAGNGEWAGKMHLDLIDAAKWAIKTKITKENSIAIDGGSYGGYASLVGLTSTPDFFACGIDVVGPANLITLLETIPPYWIPMYNSFVKAIGGDPRTKRGRKYLRSRSPLTFADRIIRPLLIAQGANDPRVKRNESDQIVNALKRAQIPVTYLLYPDEGHGFIRPENRFSFYAWKELFLSNCLGGRVEPMTGNTKSSVQVLENGNFYLKHPSYL